MNKYLKWSEISERVVINHEEFNRKVDFYRERGTLVTGSKTKLIDWCEELPYAIDYSSRTATIYCRGEDGNFYRFVSFLDVEKNEKQIEKKKGGTFAYNEINKSFRKENGKSLIAAFGRVSKSYKELVPPPILWQNPEYLGEIVHMIRKADVSSAFPYAGTMTLPDSHAWAKRTCYGRVEPTEEYPFAFYIKSKHMAIYGEFDTHDYKNYYVKDVRPFYRDIPDDEEVTVLMKASKYSLKDIMERLYEGRKENADNKIIMNSFFGYLQSARLWKGDLFMAHITAVVITRTNDRMLKCTQEIYERGGMPMLVMTDSVAWRGNVYDKTDKEKKLGAFYLEHENADMVYCRFGQYALYDPINKEFLITKHQGLDENEAAVRMEGVKNLRDFAKKFSVGFKQPIFNGEKFTEDYAL